MGTDQLLFLGKHLLGYGNTGDEMTRNRCGMGTDQLVTHNLAFNKMSGNVCKLKGKGGTGCVTKHKNTKMLPIILTHVVA